MQLTKLEIKGFKSFGDKITIHFNEGVTAIVGPNGCGKSNVVDAIRWVLGEQSTRMLRSEKMENIIFNGTKTRKPSHLAEVSLSFDNTKNILPTEFSQVTITRKLYRTGESEYRLNDVRCRLKDITDLFLDTGIGADSYSIIELRMIDEIINNKDNSRRNLFEEASGISKYKVRKKQTLNKLRDTQADLDRVEDLLFEIEKNLKTLENQARKTERYYKLKEQYKQFSIDLATLRIRDFQENLDALQQQELSQKTGQTRILTEIHQLEAALQALKQETLVQEKNLAAQQKVTNEHIGKIRAYESDKKVRNEQLRNLQAQESRLSNELAQDKQQFNHVGYNIKRLTEELADAQQKLETFGADLSHKQREVEELRGQQQSLKGKVDQANRQSQMNQQAIYDLEKEVTVWTIQRDALEQEIQRNMVDTESREQELGQFNAVIAELEQKHESLSAQRSFAQEQEDLLQQQIQATAERIAALKEEINRESRLLDARENEYNLTKSLVDNLEGFPESIRFLRKHAGWKKPYPLFSDILFCKEGYRIAIENYLEPIMNHYVVETRQEAVHAIQLLRDSSRGRAHFFVLEAIGGGVKAASAGAAHGEATGAKADRDPRYLSALEIISVDAKYQVLCQQLLKDVFLLRDPQGDEKADLPYPGSIVLHPEGKFTINQLGLSGGSVGLFEGKRIGRAKNLENLSKEIKASGELIHKLTAELTESNHQITAWTGSSQKELLAELDLQINRLNQELVSVKTKYEQHQAFITNTQNRKADIKTKIEALDRDLQAAQPRLAELNIKKTEQEGQLQLLNEQYLELSDLLTDKSGVYNQENLRFHQQKNTVASLNKDLEYRYSQQENLEKRLEKNEAEYGQTKTAIQETLQHVDLSDDGLIEMYAEKESLEAGLKELENSYYALREKANVMEEQIAIARREKEAVDEVVSGLKDQENELKIALNALKERLSVEFNIDIRDLIESGGDEGEESGEGSEKSGETPKKAEAEPAGLDQQQLTEKTEKLKRQLDDFGSINPMAMEAYQEMNERYTFIVKEKQDLLDAKNSLLETIDEIDTVAKEKFMESFNQVRENFIRVFRSLFNEEDSCDLILSDPENPLESDIDIVARPKGKRPLSINQLSGGEKTLTSTALLFSLYLLKPAPFCIFDEVDAPLDDTNIDKFNKIIREFSAQSQFIVVSHNKRTIASTDIIYGVTMVEQGVSRVVAVDMREVS